MNISKSEFLEHVRAESAARKSTATLVAKKELREQLEGGLAEYLKNGGKVDVLPRGQCVTFRSPCFDKSKTQLAALAKKYKRKTFSYWCDHHGIGQHRVKDMSCLRCGVKS